MSTAFDFFEVWRTEEEDPPLAPALAPAAAPAVSTAATLVSARVAATDTADEERDLLLREIETLRQDRTRLVAMLAVGGAFLLLAMQTYVSSVNRKIGSLREEMWYFHAK